MKRLSLLLAISSILFAPACYSGSRPPRIGHAAKDFMVQDSDRKVSRDQFKGQILDVDQNAYHHFIKERGVNFLTVRDPEQKVPAMYGTTGWPETYIIDRQGVIRRKFIGAVDWSSPEVIQFLNQL